MTPDLLAALNEARAAKRRACLVRYLATADEVLMVDGEAMLGVVPAGRGRGGGECAAPRPVVPVDTSRGRPSSRCSTRRCG